MVCQYLYCMNKNVLPFRVIMNFPQNSGSGLVSKPALRRAFLLGAPEPWLLDPHRPRRVWRVLSRRSVAQENSEQAPFSLAVSAGTNPRFHSRALQLPDAIRKLSLLLRRYARWATGPRNPSSVAFSCFASSVDELCPVGHNPGGSSRSPRERCGASVSEGCDPDLPARSLFKSYTKDLSFQIFELVFQHRLADMLLPTAVPLQCYDLEHTREYAYCYS
jgi:hypothetical protein